MGVNIPGGSFNGDYFLHEGKCKEYFMCEGGG